MANVPNLSVVRDPSKPKKLGRYEFEESLGSEGNRETYRARVKGLAGFDRIFALKCLRRRGGTTLGRSDPFLVAAKRMTAVIDPRIARVLDADIIDGVAVAVTEYVHGLDLDRFREWAQVSGELATGGDPSAQKWQRVVAYVGSEIAAALAALHAHSPPIVHGALSPRNVIITSRGGVKLLDAGLAVAAQKGGEPPSARAAAYAAPAPAGADPTTASDVRALGAMLFELATGELPAAGTTSAAARRVLESVWPVMAEPVANMLAEDPALRPRAPHVAEALAKHWAEVPEATMASEMATLVRNFSAFVADGPPSGGTAAGTPPPVRVEVEPPPGIAGGPVAPAEPVRPAPVAAAAAEAATASSAVASGSFLAVSDAETRVSPEGGSYASAIFKALPAEPSAAAAPAAAPVGATSMAALRATLGSPIGRPTLRSFSPPKPPEPAAVKAAVAAALPPRQAPLPVLSVGPLSRGAAASPTLPPLPVVTSPFVSHGAGLRLASPLAATIALVPEAPVLQPSVAAGSAAPPGERTTVEEIEAEPMPETVDWGAQALAALGTQAGVSVALLPVAAEAQSMPAADAPPEAPGIAAAFAFTPQSPPATEAWVGPQPISQGAATIPTAEPAVFSPLPRQELLEEELLDEEQPAVLVSTGDGADAGNEAMPPTGDIDYGAAAEDVQQADEPQPGSLEASAFAEYDGAAEPPQPFEPTAEEMVASEPELPRPARVRSALRSRARLDEADDAEALGMGRSRRKTIALVLISAAGLGAAAAALTLTLRKSAAPVPVVATHVRKLAASTAATRSAQPALAAKRPPSEASEPASAPKTASERRVAGTQAGVVAGRKPQPEASAAGAKVTAATSRPSEAQIAAAKPSNTSGKAAPEPVATTKTPVIGHGSAETAKPDTAKRAPQATVADGPGGTVRVRVATEPEGARVWVDGEDRGQTPSTLSLKPGSVRVVLVHSGYLTSQLTVDVRSGASVEQKLKPVEPPMTGESRFRAECQTQGKLPIVIDGKETGVLCPFSKLRVDPGVHSIGLLIPATGKIHQKEVTLSPGVRSIVFGD